MSAASDAPARATREEVIAAYRLVLGREPENEAVIALYRQMDRPALLATFLGSEEARRTCPGLARPAPAVAPYQFYPGYAEADLRVFEAFPPVPLAPRRGFIGDFLGNRTRIGFSTPYAALDGTVGGHPVPGDHHADACEWLGLLKAVLGAADRFRMAELGAGYGPWIVAGHAAARQRGIADIRLYGVEGNAAHAAFMAEHCRDNGIDPDRHVLLHAAIGTASGVARWPVVAAEAAPDHYGLRPAEPGMPDHIGRSFEAYVEVPMLGLADLLGREERWDLLHIDVQGMEGELCAAAADALARQVRWLVIGTHSRKLDGDLMALFHAEGWALEHERPAQQVWRPAAPSLEAMVTVDGTQVWRNPRLAEPVTG